MCLSQVTDNYPTKGQRGKGWRLFRIAENGNLFSPYKENTTVRPRNRWLRARTSVRTSIQDNRHYVVGWHVFTTKKDALNLRKLKRQQELDSFGDYLNMYVVMQVEWRECLAEGIFKDMHCICVESMRILGEKTKGKKVVRAPKR
jgi:hypothetical protein